MITDYFKLAVRNIRKRKLRSWLTLIGIFISVAVIFILISLSLGLQGAIEEQFQMLGSDKLFIQPKGSFGPPGSGGAVSLTIEDVNIVEKINGVKSVSYITIGNAKVEFNHEARYLMIAGIPSDGLDLYMESGAMSIEGGKNLQDKETGKIIVGYDFKYNAIFDKIVNPGSKLIINDKEFEVNGIVSRIGNPSDDKNIIMNIEDFKVLFNSGERADVIFVQIESGENIRDVASRIELKLRKFRGTSEKNQDFTILTPEELLKSFQTILMIITAFLISIAGISLIVGAVGIANTMYTSVIERTREIGVMKAIGAKNSDILSIFVIEAGMIGMIGGIIGVIIGIGVVKIVEYIAINQLGTTLLRAAIPAYLVVGCILFSFAIGSLSGFFPARQASRIKVVDALRYE